MKLLLDQNLSRRLIPLLEEDYPGSSQVALLGLEKATDENIWQYAKNNNFIIVTKDSDFEELSIIRGTPPKVIWIKLGNSMNKIILDVLIENKEGLKALLEDDEISCVELFG